MTNVPSLKIDLIKELRLRRWARMYYVPQPERAANWHPVVLEEMLRIDVEHQAMEPIQARSAGFVPLAPQEYATLDPHRRFHPLHSEIAAPNVVKRCESFDRISEELH